MTPTLPGMSHTDAVLSHREILRIVRERLYGLADRQRVRDAIRRSKKRSPRKTGPRQIEFHIGESFMKSPIVFRATFRGPLGSINPGGFNVPGEIGVEVYQSKSGKLSEWKARRPGTRTDFPITPQSRPDTLQRQIVGQYFEGYSDLSVSNESLYRA